MKTNVFEVKQQNSETKCSIIIAARNEAGNIENILSDLVQQEYPRELFEIIVINDHSIDTTAKIVSFFQQSDAITLINLDEGKNGKKEALSEGIRLSNAELLLTLDADCRITKQWLATMVGYYKETNASIIIGPVDFHYKKGMWNAIQNLEFLSLVGTSACATNNGQPFLCNGANLAYKRKLYLQFEDPFSKEQSSGDDVFFLHNVKKLPDALIHFIKHPDAIAKTDGAGSFHSFFSQRIRWASKSKKINDPETLVFISIILAMNVLLIFLLIASFVKSEILFIFFSVVGIKLIIDYTFFKQILPFFKKDYLLKHIPLTTFLYFIYFACMLLCAFILKPQWKGRSVNV
jgi:cellulose synthase/poly-beta-1,6-N-acetylglucosamine synthase-like glycosyltransferase